MRYSNIGDEVFIEKGMFYVFDRECVSGSVRLLRCMIYGFSSSNERGDGSTVTILKQFFFKHAR